MPVHPLMLALLYSRYSLHDLRDAINKNFHYQLSKVCFVHEVLESNEK